MKNTTGRIASLDALRGVAASAVVLNHALAALSHYGLNPASAPLYVLLGRLPVTIFFALSGYVLALPFFNGHAPVPESFLVKRLLRIYLPYVGVAAIAALAYGVQDYRVAAETLVMTGTPTGVSLNPPFWSLVVEMRFSLIFPLLVALVARAPRVAGVCAVAAAAISAAFMPWMSGEPFAPTDGFTPASSLVVTAYYAPLFVGGILLARYEEAARAFVAARGKALWVLVAVGVGVALRFDLALAAVAVAVVALVPMTPPIVELFKARVLVWLGRISYSLYLVHGVVLLTLWRWTQNGPLAIALFIPVSLLLAELSYRSFEIPSVRLGRVVSAFYSVTRTPSRADA